MASLQMRQRDLKVNISVHVPIPHRSQFDSEIIKQNYKYLGSHQLVRVCPVNLGSDVNKRPLWRFVNNYSQQGAFTPACWNLSRVNVHK